MRLDYATLERADAALIAVGKFSSPLLYLRELESLCKFCGWSLSEYWNTMLGHIDAGWDDAYSVN